MISTKGRYSIRILLDLAEHGSSSGYAPMKEVAVRQDISLKYIERILPPLKNAGLIASTHGIGGGYRLTRPPEDYTLWEILCIAEGDLAPVACLQPNAVPCSRAAECRTLPVWEKLESLICGYLDEVTLTSLLDGGAEIGGCPSVKK